MATAEVVRAGQPSRERGGPLLREVAGPAWLVRAPAGPPVSPLGVGGRPLPAGAAPNFRVSTRFLGARLLSELQSGPPSAQNRDQVLGVHLEGAARRASGRHSQRPPPRAPAGGRALQAPAQPEARRRLSPGR